MSKVPALMELTVEMGRKLNKQKGQIAIKIHVGCKLWVITIEDRPPSLPEGQ